MRYTVPQLKLLQEGELYGHYTMGGKGADPSGDPIDQLVNLVQGHFIDWDLSDPKFFGFFLKTHPHATPRYLEERGGLKQVILDELPASNQTEQLIRTLIKKTQESGPQGPSILDAPTSDIDLSVRSQAVIKDMNLDTLGKLISTPKEELIKHRYVGRVTIKELGRRVAEFVDDSRRDDSSYSIPPEVEAKLVEWVNSTYTSARGLNKDKVWTPYRPDQGSTSGGHIGKFASRIP